MTRQFGVALLLLVAPILPGSSASLYGYLRESIATNVTLSGSNPCSGIDWDHDTSHIQISTVDVNKNAKHVWGLNPNFKIKYRRDNDDWDNVDGELEKISVSGNGRHIWGLVDGRAVYRFVNDRDPINSNGKWNNFSENRKFDSVAVNTCGNVVFGVEKGSKGELLWRNGGSKKGTRWQNFNPTLDNRERLTQVVVSGDGRHVFALDSDGKIWWSTLKNGRWRNISGNYSFTYVSVDASGDNIWALEARHNVVWYKQSKSDDQNAWNECPSNNYEKKSISVSGDAESVWLTDIDNHVSKASNPPKFMPRLQDEEEIHCVDTESIVGNEES